MLSLVCKSKVNCEENKSLIDGYLDGELDPLTSRKVEQHMRQCAGCEQAYRVHTAVAQAIAGKLPYHKAPADLRWTIQRSLREAVGAKITELSTQDRQPSDGWAGTRRQPRLLELRWDWLALAAAVILVAIVGSSLLPRLRQNGSDQFLATQLIASHVRSLMASHLTDVASSDQHTVKPWLDAKLDFAAPVVDLTAEGFPLIGGRLDYLDSHPVAALVYQRRKHYINLFVWPATPDASKASKSLSRQGYHLLHWIDQDFAYWAVSDVNEKDLQVFKQLFEAKTAVH